ncbi:MAG: hypothetical protein M1840_008634, partial [Geoglossum simile]
MDGLSEAASIIAVVGISAKITSLCFQYLTEVKAAKNDIERLQRKVAEIRGLLEKIKQLLDGRDKAWLSTTSELSDSLKECFRELEELKAELEPGKARKAMSRFGVRALKWPLTNKQVEKMVVSLEKYKGLIISVDQKLSLVDKKTDNLLSKIDIVKLPIAEGASFDSHIEEYNARCTEKSTIAWTVTQLLAGNGWLGASFFFKKGEGERSNASRFFTTIATDLMARIPELIPGIRKALDADSGISGRLLKDQFEKLILYPLSEIQQAPSQALAYIVVI